MVPLRTKLLAAVPGGEVTPARLGRISPRTLLTLVAAVYVLAGVLGRASLRGVLGEADWRWAIAALALSAATYAAAEALMGFVPGRLSFRLTCSPSWPVPSSRWWPPPSAGPR